ncbi:MAG: FkbM family methyltransferase [Bacteroidota bacterium]
MTLHSIIHKISQREDIINQPPVLLDIGASEGINPMWQSIAKFSVCIAFDADNRDFEYIVNDESHFKKLYSFSKIVVDKHEGDSSKRTFYLTQSPYCSSLLHPDNTSVAKYHFSDLFNVIEEAQIDTITLNEVIAKTGVPKIDWFKSDTQGTDLRLFTSVPKEIQEKVLILELEPGFIDAYKGEDKIFHAVQYLESLKQFFLIHFTVKGPYRLPANDFNSLFPSAFTKTLAHQSIKPIPGWAEMIYMNELNQSTATARDYVLSWLFATLQERHDVAYTYAKKADEVFNETIFRECLAHSVNQLKGKTHGLGNIIKVIVKAVKKRIS